MKNCIVPLILFLATGCDLVVDVDMPVEKPKLVLNSLFSPDSVWRAKVSYNRHILDQAPYVDANDATVVILEEDTPIDTLQYDTLGYYTSKTAFAKTGKYYSIKAIRDGFGEVHATSFCPEKVAAEFSAIEETTDENGQKIYTFSITFDDPPGENFYQVLATFEYRYKNPYTGQGFIQISTAQVESDDAGIDNEEIPNFEGFFFPDALFANKRFTVNVKMRAFIWQASSDITFNIRFRTLSKDYYRYKVTSLLQDYVSGDPFAQPVKVYNNIENGFGVFAGYTQQAMIFKP